MSNVSDFYKRLRDLCEENGNHVHHLTKTLNISSGSLTAWKKGVIPRGKTLSLISEYFGVSVGYLLGEEETPVQPKSDGDIDLSNITETQRMIIESVLNMPVEKQKALAQILGLEV